MASVRDNFLMPVLDELTAGRAVLDLLLTNEEELFRVIWLRHHELVV